MPFRAGARPARVFWTPWLVTDGAASILDGLAPGALSAPSRNVSPAADRH